MPEQKSFDKFKMMKIIFRTNLVVLPDVRAECGEDAADGGDDGEGEGDADHGVHDAE